MLYKNKGSKDDPSKYRCIIIMDTHTEQEHTALWTPYGIYTYNIIYTHTHTHGIDTYDIMDTHTD